MKTPSPKTTLVVGIFLMLAGAILPFLMVIHILESTFFLNFIAFGSQVTGLFLGTIGMITYARAHKR
jgi:hypothetical protein